MTSLVDKPALGPTVKDKHRLAQILSRAHAQNVWRSGGLHKPDRRAGRRLCCCRSSTEPGLKLLAPSQN